MLKKHLSWTLAGALAYTLLSAAVFELPTDLASAEACGFVASDFTPDGHLAMPPLGAWWLSSQRQHEAWTAVSVGLALAFMALAWRVGRQAGTSRAAGATVGGGLLALSALCISCLAPVLSVVGLGVLGTVLVGLPKWLVTLNVTLLTGWGSLLLLRRAQACPLPLRPPPTAGESKACTNTESQEGNHA